MFGVYASCVSIKAERHATVANMYPLISIFYLFIAGHIVIAISGATWGPVSTPCRGPSGDTSLPGEVGGRVDNNSTQECTFLSFRLYLFFCHCLPLYISHMSPVEPFPVSQVDCVVVVVVVVVFIVMSAVTISIRPYRVQVCFDQHCLYALIHSGCMVLIRSFHSCLALSIFVIVFKMGERKRNPLCCAVKKNKDSLTGEYTASLNVVNDNVNER